MNNSIIWHILFAEHQAWLLEERKETQNSPYLAAYKAADLNGPKHFGKSSPPWEEAILSKIMAIGKGWNCFSVRQM